MPTKEELESWVWPDYFEPYPRVDKCKPRVGINRKLKSLLAKAKEQGIIINAELKKFEEEVEGGFYIYNLNLCKRLTPKFRTVSKCVEILPDFLESK